MDVAALQQRAIASSALKSYHEAARDYLSAMAKSQEARSPVLGAFHSPLLPPALPPRECMNRIAPQGVHGPHCPPGSAWTNVNARKRGMWSKRWHSECSSAALVRMGASAVGACMPGASWSLGLCAPAAAVWRGAACCSPRDDAPPATPAQGRVLASLGPSLVTCARELCAAHRLVVSVLGLIQRYQRRMQT